jgi:hypothetical protein
MTNLSDESLFEYAARFARLLRDSLKIDLPESLEHVFIRQAKRVGVANYEDLGSWVLLECLERKASGEVMSQEGVFRAIDRVRKRITRRARRLLISGAILGQLAEPPRAIPEKTNLIVNEFREILSGLSPIHVLVFDCLFLNKKGAKEVAAELNLSLATVYRRADDIKRAFAEFRQGERES